MRIITNPDGTELIQNSNEWLIARLAVLTGSKANKAFKSTKPEAKVSMIEELIAEELTGTTDDDGFKSSAMEWGHLHEPTAIAEYEARTGLKCHSIGFVLHDEHDWLGLSPDRFVKKGRSKVFNHAVEVKCPGSKKFIKYMIDRHIPPEYLPQVLHYFIVCETLESLDFVIFDPRIQQKEFQMMVITVTRKELEKAISIRTKQYEAFRKDWDELKLQLLTQSIKSYGKKNKKIVNK